jgi:hypothetical protein
MSRMAIATTALTFLLSGVTAIAETGAARRQLPRRAQSRFRRQYLYFCIRIEGHAGQRREESLQEQASLALPVRIRTGR